MHVEISAASSRKEESGSKKIGLTPMKPVKERKSVLDESQQRIIVTASRYTAIVTSFTSISFGIRSIGRVYEDFHKNDGNSNSGSQANGSDVSERSMLLTLILLDTTVNYIRVCLNFGFAQDICERYFCGCCNKCVHNGIVYYTLRRIFHDIVDTFDENHKEP